MRRSKTLEKIRAGSTVRICGLGYFIPSYVRFAAHYGFDCIWLDLEHRVMDDREIQALLAYFHLFDIDCMLRPPTLEKARLHRYLEDGASGLLIPHVSTVEKAQMLVQAIKFPPLGDRGLDAAGLDSDFSLHGKASYTDQANQQTFLFVQIETVEAVRNVEEIAAVEGVDGLFIGPADLALRLKNSPENSLTIEQATNRVASAAKKCGKAWGQPAYATEQLQELHAMGARILAHGGDTMAMNDMLSTSASHFDKVCNQE